MLQTLREKAAVKKFVLWIVVLGMASGIGVGVTAVWDTLFGRGRSAAAADPSGPWVLQIGPDTISVQKYQNELRVISRAFQDQGIASTPEFASSIQYEAVNSIVRRTLALQEARKAGLTVTDQEVSDRIVSMPELRPNGQFVGRDEYKRLLASNDLDVAAFEKQIREGMLAEKWETLVRAGALVTDREIQEEYERRNQKVRFDFVIADPARLAKTPGEAEIKAAFEAHPERYQKGEARRARVVVFDTGTLAANPPQVSDEEIRKAWEADRTRYQGTLEASRPEILRQLSFQMSQAELQRRATEFRASVASPEALDGAAQQAGLKVEDTGPLRRDPQGLTRYGPSFLDALFRATRGSVEGPVETLSGNAVFVVTETQPPGQASLAEARDSILADLAKDKGKEAALAAARAAMTSAAGDLETVASKLGSTVRKGTLVGHGESQEGLGYEPSVEAAAFGAAPGSLAGPVTTLGGSAVVLKVIEKNPADPAGIAAARDQIRSDLKQNRELLLLNSILDSALKKTEFKRNDEYFKQLGT